ncbi:DNA primase [Streptomyces sp. CRN 30]|uniref:DNA primase n=1 Tax=Streptomyces sp. CRN 30 TaxID=3075613 RepID=UPI002A8010AA|nr:DNA primase [Streptomyces sp. CRN 30]
MNRVGLGLAVGAGYLLGRTKKLKLAVAVGTMVAGKKMNLTPRGIAELVSTQLQNNPQFKEIGDQLRGDLRGVGKAATGAMVERQISSLADRLHGRTAQVQDQLSGVASSVPGVGRDRDDRADDYDDEYDEDDYDARDARDDRDDRDEDADRDEPRERAPERGGGRTAKKATGEARKTAKRAPAKKTAAKKTAAKQPPARKAAAKKTQSATKTARGAARGARGAAPKSGGER